MMGVLGGMGPLATVDFLTKLMAATPATCDADHVPLLIQCDPRIAPRPAAILSGAPSPLPALRAGRDRLVAGGALALAMPCNTAHFWHAELARDCPVPFLSIVQACCDELGALAAPGASIGLIATRATLAARIFDAPLQAAGYGVLLPEDAALEELILPAIAQVKAGRAAEGGPLIEQAVARLMAQGSAAVILACTETPVALDAIASPLRTHCIDSTAALARSCVAWWSRHGDGIAAARDKPFILENL